CTRGIGVAAYFDYW
nr:immunoglobulin heavy chain junction region [Macaca mulatta]MOW32174.1 immunoglobulin heavy chain junction region [Macaca mulatta]MOW33065.1 immunoglobulin heavy chain junction region [Macaca mulatta]MOW33138.1 immunoglobulin heavy chain junction region [Macaca mulatta]MOW33453.1 immunoglobulin heavy chain junction region [Macaca mulatta]